MNEKTIELDIPLLLPDIQSAQDQCIRQVEITLQSTKGIQKAHVLADATPAQLCLHYDPNLISLGSVKQRAREAGTAFTERYRHETIPYAGMSSADAAQSLTHTLAELPGMLHATVNYAAGLIFIAYDSEVLSRTAIDQQIKQMGYREVTPVPEDEGHDHGSAPTFLPHWMQERWELLLIALAGLFLLIGWVGEQFLGMPASISLIFYILSLLAGGYDLATHAVPALFKRQFDTDVLMLAAAIGAAILGEWAEGAFLLFLFGLGHAGEHYALDRARDAVNALGKLMPATAQRKQGDQLQEVPVEQLQLDDVVVVRPGDRMPVDGEILTGKSTLDQSAITGESKPVSKGVGEEVFAGTINQEQALDVRVTKLAKDNTLARVMQLVAEAQEQQSPTQQLAQRFSSHFVPGILIFVFLVIVIPPLFGWMDWTASFYRGMLLLVAASPCALAIGTPASVLAGIGQAARNGVLIKGGVHLENLGRIKVMAFDKTGTLTEGAFRVTDVIPVNDFATAKLLQIVGSVEQQSNHPLAQAVVAHAKAEGATLGTAGSLTNHAGQGVESEFEGKRVLIGNWKLFVNTSNHPQDAGVLQMIEALENAGKTTMAVSYDEQFAGILALADTVRPHAKATLAKLKEIGITHTVMLTGDNEDVAQQIGAQLGVTDIRAELMPEQKLEAIRALKEQYGEIAMTGDGVNDAPALATATVGIAMGGAGTAVALETADVALMGDDLSKLPFAVGLSRASRRNILQNFGISLAVIALLLVTSVFGLIELRGAVILHEGSTLFVVANALRLLRYKA